LFVLVNKVVTDCRVPEVTGVCLTNNLDVSSPCWIAVQG